MKYFGNVDPGRRRKNSSDKYNADINNGKIGRRHSTSNGVAKVPIRPRTTPRTQSNRRVGSRSLLNNRGKEER